MLSLLAQSTDTTNTMSSAQVGAIFAGFGVFIAVMLLIGLITFIFSLWMIIDAFGRKEEEFPMGSKAIWIIVLIAGIFLGYGLLAAIAYFFLVKRKTGQGKNSPNQTPPTEVPTGSDKTAK